MPVPVLLLTGFLGAGKTTILNRLLERASGTPIAVLVNDFGAINIDAALLESAHDGVVSLPNGCICCSLEGDLLRALAAVLRQVPRPEAILIEPSGLADPSEIVRTLLDPAIAREAPLDVVLCVVDAATSARSLDEPLQRAQLRTADIVALSKTDLVDAATVSSVRAAVASLAPRAIVVEAVHGDVPHSLLFPGQGGAPRALPPSTRRPASDRFESLSWTAERALDLPLLQRAIGQLAPKLARAKGLFELASQPGRRLLLQLAGGRASVTPAGQTASGAPLAQFVFVAEIGTLSEAQLGDVMRTSLARKPEPASHTG